VKIASSGGVTPKSDAAAFYLSQPTRRHAQKTRKTKNGELPPRSEQGRHERFVVLKDETQI
jgi:hypothetical protein